MLLSVKVGENGRAKFAPEGKKPKSSQRLHVDTGMDSGLFPSGNRLENRSHIVLRQIPPRPPCTNHPILRIFCGE